MTRVRDVGAIAHQSMVLLIGTALVLGNASCSAQGDQRPPVAESAAGGVAPVATTTATRTEISATDAKRFRDAATVAWTYLDANYQPATGLVSATPDWHNTTIWDVGGELLAFHAAKGLGLLSQAEFDKRTRRALTTLESAPLFHGIAFSKVYDTKTGKVGDGGARGFAATDLGRFLVAMKVLSVTEPQHAAQIARVVKRLDFGQIVKDGYLYGQLTGSSGKPFSFQEGRIGYEQYMARGFQEWGADVHGAMDLKKNAEPVSVYGVPLLKDTRYQDRLLSEPFILYGLELGMPSDVQELAGNVLRAQQARFDSTGKLTAVTEDASSIAPYYFYYYCVYCNGKPFVVDISEPGKELDSPRWVSTKAAFGWHALMPTPYTDKLVNAVVPAADQKRGWASGVTESAGTSTGAYDVNTASVVLESAYYALRGGKPLIDTTTALVTPR